MVGNRLIDPSVSISRFYSLDMKIRILLLAALISLPSVVALRAENQKKQPQEETELEGKMDKMGSAWRKLKRQVADPSKNAESLELLAAIRVSAEEAAKLSPAKADDVHASDRAKFVADYQAEMRKLIVELDKLEAALKADKNDEATKLVADIGAMQKAGHKEFQRPQDKK